MRFWQKLNKLNHSPYTLTGYCVRVLREDTEKNWGVCFRDSVSWCLLASPAQAGVCFILSLQARNYLINYSTNQQFVIKFAVLGLWMAASLGRPVERGNRLPVGKGSQRFQPRKRVGQSFSRTGKSKR